MLEALSKNLDESSWRTKWELFTHICWSFQYQTSSQLYLATTWIQPSNTLSSFSLSNLCFPLVSLLTGVTCSYCHHHCCYWPTVHVSRNTFRKQFPSCAHMFGSFWSGQSPARLNLVHAGPLPLPEVSSCAWKHREIWAASLEEAPGKNNWQFSKDKRPYCKLMEVRENFLLLSYYGICLWLATLAVSCFSYKVWQLQLVYHDLFLI